MSMMGIVAAFAEVQMLHKGAKRSMESYSKLQGDAQTHQIRPNAKRKAELSAKKPKTKKNKPITRKVPTLFEIHEMPAIPFDPVE